MSREICFCEGKHCPIKEDCLRFNTKPTTGEDIWIFTEIPGRLCDALRGGNPKKPEQVWVCDKKLLE